MFVLIWAALLFSTRGTITYTGASVGERIICEYGFCITLSDERQIIAEAGLCAVIPCSFTSGYGFIPQNMVWYKCDSYRHRCADSDIIFHTNKYNQNVQSEFKGRVSLLEPDVNQNNCSIIINDLTESDSGSYQFRVNGYARGRADGFTFTPRAIVSVKDLMQKPTVMKPLLTAGQQTTLTCTAPGLCSGSRPKITWTWSRTAEQSFHIPENITAFKTERLTAVSERHSSTLTFNPSAIHHGTNLTCKVSFTGGTTTEETVTLNVTYVKEVQITGNTSVKEGETLNLTCSVESFPPSLITWANCSEETMQNATENNLKNQTETCQHGQSETGTFSISNVTAEHSGKYICIANHLNNTLMKEVDVMVMYVKTPVISGDTAVEEGNALSLTCSVKSFPLSQITWTIPGSNTNLQKNPGSATLVIPTVTADNSGQYICTAEYLNTTVTKYANVTVIIFPKILNTSGCEVQSEVLTCVCVSVGIPLPTISWPLLESHAVYSVTTNVSNHTVSSSVTLTVKDLSTTECVSSNTNGKAQQSLAIQNITSDPQGQVVGSNVVSRLEVIIAFLIGVLLSAVICCLAKICRKRKKSSGNLNNTVEMMPSQEDPLIVAGQAEDQTYYQEAATEGEDVAAEIAALGFEDDPKDVDYANIDFSMLKITPRDAAKKQDSTETEYVEIKNEIIKERKNSGGEKGEVLEGKEEEVMIGEDETNLCVTEEEDEEDEEDSDSETAVYSNVKEIMGKV